MTHSFELKTGKKIDLTPEELSEFVELILLFTNSLPDKVIYKSVTYPVQPITYPVQPITYPVQPITYPEFGYPIITCGSV